MSNLEPPPYQWHDGPWDEPIEELERNLFSSLYGGSPLSRPRPKIQEEEVSDGAN